MNLPAVGAIVRHRKRNYIVVQHGCLAGEGYSCLHGDRAVECRPEEGGLSMCLDGTQLSEVIDTNSTEIRGAITEHSSITESTAS